MMSLHEIRLTEEIRHYYRPTQPHLKIHDQGCNVCDDTKDRNRHPVNYIDRNYGPVTPIVVTVLRQFGVRRDMRDTGSLCKLEQNDKRID